jgi:hypothetical protein
VAFQVYRLLSPALSSNPDRIGTGIGEGDDLGQPANTSLKRGVNEIGKRFGRTTYF